MPEAKRVLFLDSQKASIGIHGRTMYITLNYWGFSVEKYFLNLPLRIKGVSVYFLAGTAGRF